MSLLNVNAIEPSTGTDITLGASGDTTTVPSGATLDISASTLTPPATMPASSGVNFTALNATNLGSGTVAIARGGTGAATLAAAGLANTPAFFVKVNAAQTITTATWTQVSYQTEMLDTDSAYNTTDFKFTPQTAGWYYLFASYGWNTNTDFEATYIQICKNQTTQPGVSSSIVPNIYYNTLKTSVVVEANGSSDYFAVSCYQASGSNKDTQNDTTMGYFGGYKLIGA
jgi:hypothetical protein